MPIAAKRSNLVSDSCCCCCYWPNWSFSWWRLSCCTYHLLISAIYIFSLQIKSPPMKRQQPMQPPSSPQPSKRPLIVASPLTVLFYSVLFTVCLSVCQLTKPFGTSRSASNWKIRKEKSFKWIGSLFFLFFFSFSPTIWRFYLGKTAAFASSSFVVWLVAVICILECTLDTAERHKHWRRTQLTWSSAFGTTFERAREIKDFWMIKFNSHSHKQTRTWVTVDNEKKSDFDWIKVQLQILIRWLH